MNAFLEAYPWIVLSLGLISAAFSVILGIFLAFTFAVRLEDKLDEWRMRLFGATAFVALGNGFAILILAFTKWMLAACQ